MKAKKLIALIQEQQKQLRAIRETPRWSEFLSGQLSMVDFLLMKWEERK